MKDKLAGVMKKMEDIIWDAMTCAYANAIKHPGEGLINFYKPHYYKGQILNTPIPIEVKCPECKGLGRKPAYNDYGRDYTHGIVCEVCNGTGKLPDKTITVREAIERVIG